MRVRLVSGNSNSSGRVEVNYKGSWGTVCDDSFDLVSADVVCKQLGFPGGKSVLGRGYFGRGSGSIFLDDVRCIGNETSIAACNHNPWGVHNCDHREDVGVICNTYGKLMSSQTITHTN